MFISKFLKAMAFLYPSFDKSMVLFTNINIFTLPDCYLEKRIIYYKF
jgi:hypothetical protein